MAGEEGLGNLFARGRRSKAPEKSAWLVACMRLLICRCTTPTQMAAGKVVYWVFRQGALQA